MKGCTYEKLWYIPALDLGIGREAERERERERERDGQKTSGTKFHVGRYKIEGL